ncbi:ribosome small subunit-dependent GTPase A [Limnoglobus roseus]|uniref:Small ribosomal subunit biogenesis GTPase RsgA n=1 Tax=Limnoglobus roseus TaxID=2598579 RepID=A0A5C1A8E5_9BACT|nr:ribosome small subunit-dependent GTPase A [Limnoglobus roseus]QEL14463.1 ribosome small subunit-dependent GTPase A [Limnoglobus roseus]
MASKKKKVRVEMRRNLSKPPRENDVTRQFQDNGAHDVANTERVRAKGDASRHRTIMAEDAAAMPGTEGGWVRGRVVRVHGLYSYVELDDGRTVRCTVRRVLKSLQVDERSIVTTGDWVWVAAGGDALRGAEPEGVIERIDPRHGVLTRSSRRREHVLVANVDQLVIVMSLVQPELKVHLIDRYIASAEKGGLKPVLVLNKIDLADPVALQPLVGAYSQIGIPTILASAQTGVGVARLRAMLKDRATVFSGQSGVGKSSLLNAAEPGLSLRVSEVSDVNQKGKHTTTTAELIRLSFGGWVVDTPGVRQLQLWDTRPEEVEGYFSELRPFIALCRFPDCTHTHESDCRVKDAVRRKLVSGRRYYSYLGLFNGVEE